MCFVSIISEEARGQKVFPMDFSLFHLPGSDRYKPPSALLPLVLKVRQYLTSTDQPPSPPKVQTQHIHEPKGEIHPNALYLCGETRICINNNMKKCHSLALINQTTFAPLTYMVMAELSVMPHQSSTAPVLHSYTHRHFTSHYEFTGKKKKSFR